jgi:hypothetical protein
LLLLLLLLLLPCGGASGQQDMQHHAVHNHLRVCRSEIDSSYMRDVYSSTLNKP